MQTQDQDLGRGWIQPPRSALAFESKRIKVFLRATDNGRFRWFREDGTPTVVDGPTVERAHGAAHIVWDSWGLKLTGP